MFKDDNVRILDIVKDIIETNKLLRKLFKKLTVSKDCKLNEKIPFIKTMKGIEKQAMIIQKK